jgi:hypothetical protein
VPVFAEEASDEERKLFPTVVRELPAEQPREALGPPPPVVERMETTDSITITGCRPGYPVLVRISYHPRWKALTGERVWLAAPSFMLVFPKGERVELVFGDGPPVILGRVLTIIGWVVFLVAVTPFGRRLAPRLAASAPARAFTHLIARTGSWSLETRRLVLAAGLLAAAFAFTAIAVAARTTDADSTYRKGQQVYDDQSRPVDERLRAALPYFREAQRLAPLSNTAVHSTYYESIILYRLEQWAEAERSFRRLLERFPEAQAAAESQYHIGLCRARLGDEEGGVAAWQETQRRYPGTPWATYAGQRLAEHGR